MQNIYAFDDFYCPKDSSQYPMLSFSRKNTVKE